MFTRGTTRAALIILGLALVLAGCEPQSAPTQSTSGSKDAPVAARPSLLRIATQIESQTLPARLLSTTDPPAVQGNMSALVNASLARGDERGVLGPDLAQALPSQEDGTWIVNPDGTMRTTWTLKPDTKWQDGTPLTAQDVVFAYNVYRDNDIPLNQRVPETYMSSVIVLNDRTFEINWNRPYATISRGDLAPLPRHLLEGLYNSDKQAFLNSTFWTSQEYVGAGPYRFIQRDPGVRLTFAANPYYVLGKPKIDNIELRIIPDENTIVANLLSGDIDFAEHGSIITDQAALLTKAWETNKEGRALLSYFGVASMRFQQRDVSNHQQALRDVRIRRALVHAIDRDALAAADQSGLSTAADLLLSPNHPLFPQMDAVVTKYPFDPRRAAQLLSDAGWTMGSDRMLRNSTGEPFRMEVLGGPVYERAGVVISDYWRQAGVDSKPVAMTPALSRNREYQSNFPGADLTTPKDFLSFRQLTAADISAAENSWSAGNRTGWVSPEFESVFLRFDRALRPTEQDELAVELERIQTSGVGFARLYYQVRPAAARSNLQGPTGLSWEANTYLFNIHEWTLR
jgi:peptide/nickel transport system substrate-binding protein